MFWETLSEDGDNETPPPQPIGEHVPDNFKALVPRLYTVGLGMGYLELPQVII